MAKRNVRIFGIPVGFGISLWTVAILVVVASQSLGSLWPLIAAVMPVVVVHEFGHAIEIRRIGGSPEITIGLLGGHTSGVPSDISPLRNIWISAAGIVYSLIFLAVVWMVDLLFGDQFPPAVAMIISAMILLNGIWALIQLLPIGTADGSHILQSVFELAGVKRLQQWMIGAVLITALALLPFAWQWGYFAVAYLAYLTFTDLSRRFSRLKLEKDARNGWTDEVNGLFAASKFAEAAERLEVIAEQAASDEFRSWAVEARLAALRRAGLAEEAGTYAEQHASEIGFWERARVFASNNDLASILSAMTTASGEPVQEVLKNDSAARSGLFGLVATMTGPPSPAWDIVRPFASGLSFSDYMATWWHAAVAGNSWMLAALDQTPVPEIDETVPEFAGYRDRKPRALRDVGELLGSEDRQKRPAAAAMLFRAGEIDVILASATSSASAHVTTLIELQRILIRAADPAGVARVADAFLELAGVNESRRAQAAANAARALLAAGERDKARFYVDQIAPQYLANEMTDEQLTLLNR